MEKLKKCANKCIFCFIDQLPADLRPTLYIKDDDYIESYTHGNFITLSNLSAKDVERIIRFRIEPLHVSIHSFNQSIRDIIFGNRKNNSAIEIFYELDKNLIRTNIQIVLCPGVNDGADLENTLNILINKFNNVLSIGIVPVGITAFNRNKLLKPFGRRLSSSLIDYIENFRDANLNNKNAKKIFLSDEFYVISGKDFPDYKYYGRLLQLQNGIGKSADFVNDFKKEVAKENGLSCRAKKNNLRKILVITSEYGGYVLGKLFKSFREGSGKISNFIVPDIVKIKNNFFGGNVKVTGLLSGRDIIEKIKSLDTSKYEVILIPGIIFNKDGLTIDDLSIHDIKNASLKIKSVKDSGKALYWALKEKT